MNDREFVTGIREQILDSNLQVYKQLFEETKIDAATDSYWQEAIGLYCRLDDADRQVLFKIMRQAMVDTVSKMFAVLDGVTSLPQQNGQFALKLSGDILNGDLQDHFLDMEEQQHS